MPQGRETVRPYHSHRRDARLRRPFPDRRRNLISKFVGPSRARVNYYDENLIILHTINICDSKGWRMVVPLFNGNESRPRDVLKNHRFGERYARKLMHPCRDSSISVTWKLGVWKFVKILTYIYLNDKSFNYRSTLLHRVHARNKKSNLLLVQIAITFLFPLSCCGQYWSSFI